MEPASRSLFAGVHFRSHRSVLFVFLTDVEPPGGATGGHWGTTLDRATLGVWLAGIAAIFGYFLCESVRAEARYYFSVLR